MSLLEVMERLTTGEMAGWGLVLLFGLLALILRGVTTVPTLGSTTFNNTAIKSGTCYVYVPKELEATFKVASNWSTYASQIRAIEDYPDICG